MLKGLTDHVFEHIDACPQCMKREPCAVGQQLMRRSAKVLAALLAPIPESKETKD